LNHFLLLLVEVLAAHRSRRAQRNH
jgi:hypothetical protein